MQAKKGDTVKVHYQGRLTDGTVFDDSKKRNEPLMFTLGKNDIIPGFDKAVEGMRANEEKKIEIPAEEAYGAHRPELVLKVNRNQLPADLTPVVGQQLQVNQDEEHYAVVSVAAIDGDTITLDANHPLAGQTLVFDITLVEICPPGCSCGNH
jgi:peptidylprolyl isomerase